MLRMLAAAAVFGAVCLATQNASAEEPAARADRLFAEGKVALNAKRFDEACAKFAESQSLDPATGTLLALGLCHEATHKYATAWRELGEVLAASLVDGRSDRVELARHHIRAVEGKYSSVTVNVAGGAARAARVKIQHDGQTTVHRADEPIPLEGGEHVIEASEPGKKPWKTVVVLKNEADRQVVVVPELPDAAEPVNASTPSEPENEKLSRTRPLGWVIGGAGGVAFLTGSIFGVMALSDRSDAVQGCPASPCANQAAVSSNDSAMTEAWVANVGIGLGLVGLAVGAYFILRPEKSH